MTATLLMTLISLTLFSFLENLFPRYPRSVAESLRHTLSNLGLAGIAIGTSQAAYSLVKSSISFPQFEVASAITPKALEIAVCILFFDFISWVWHWSNHHLFLLWRSHAAHHSDTLLNASSALRFHPFELFPSLIIRGVLAAGLGFSAEALLAFNGIYIFMNFFEHSHLQLPKKLEQILGFVFITPSLHHLHHSTDIREQNGNLGTVFSFWDRIFGYRIERDQPVDYGVIKGQPRLSLWGTLKLPLKPF